MTEYERVTYKPKGGTRSRTTILHKPRCVAASGEQCLSGFECSNSTAQEIYEPRGPIGHVRVRRVLTIPRSRIVKRVALVVEPDGSFTEADWLVLADWLRTQQT